jgi:hypothetical protein
MFLLTLTVRRSLIRIGKTLLKNISFLTIVTLLSSITI